MSVQVLFSLLAARLVTPMLAAYFLRRIRTRRSRPGGCCGPTRGCVTWSVRHYFITVAVGLVHIRRLDLEHHAAVAGLPAGAGHGRSLLAIELPPGSRLSDTEKATEDIVNAAAQPA